MIQWKLVRLFVKCVNVVESICHLCHCHCTMFEYSRAKPAKNRNQWHTRHTTHTQRHGAAESRQDTSIDRHGRSWTEVRRLTCPGDFCWPRRGRNNWKGKADQRPSPRPRSRPNDETPSFFLTFLNFKFYFIFGKLFQVQFLKNVNIWKLNSII